MPTCQIHTNIPLDKIPDSFEDEFAEVLHKEFFYPKQNFAIQVHGNQRFYFGLSRDPFVAVFFNGVWANPEENQGHSAVLSEALSNKLGVKKDRMVIYFCEYKAEKIGYNGMTVAELPGFSVPTEPQEG